MTASPLHLSDTVEISADRRRHTRIRLARVVPVHIGRGAGELIDISISGAKLKHSVAILRGARVRVRFSWRGRRVSLSAEVLASRVVALARAADGATVYESRVRFVDNPPEDMKALRTIVEALDSELLRSFVANLRGVSTRDRDLHVEEPPARARLFIRCRRDGNSWRKQWTASSKAPEDGFVVPAETPDAEVDLICRTYQLLDENGRHLLRLMAAATVETN